MTKKDYELIAHVLKLHKQESRECCVHNWAHIVIHLANSFAVNNAKFDKSRFMYACGADQ